MAIEILRQCEKEIADWPEEVSEDLVDAVARLERDIFSHYLYLVRCLVLDLAFTNFGFETAQEFIE